MSESNLVRVIVGPGGVDVRARWMERKVLASQIQPQISSMRTHFTVTVIYVIDSDSDIPGTIRPKYPVVGNQRNRIL